MMVQNAYSGVGKRKVLNFIFEDGIIALFTQDFKMVSTNPLCIRIANPICIAYTTDFGGRVRYACLVCTRISMELPNIQET